MAPLGIFLGKVLEIPVIFDMAENYVALLKVIWVTDKFKGLNVLVRNPYLARFVESYSFKNADHILAVVEESVKIVKKFNSNVTLISNTPQLNKITISSDIVEPSIPEGKFSAIYVGGITKHRGLQTLFHAIPLIIKQIPSFLLIIVGDGQELNNLKALVDKLNIEKYVLFTGFIDNNKIYKLIKRADIGLIPHIKCEHTDTTVPNKLFDYMGCGLPIIASDTIPLKRIINEEKVGITYEYNKPEKFFEAIVKIFGSDYDYGKNGKRSVKNRYNWDIDSEKLNSLVSNISQRL
jgi:glycosyltransferase involved in cell wall biosynthesis